jgi:mono/diheme cytochrome c family protein
MHPREYSRERIGARATNNRIHELEKEMRSPIVVAVVFGVSLLGFSQESKVHKTTAPQTSPASGKEMYTAYCASCHGADLKGSGPAAQALKTPPTDLTGLQKANGGSFPSDHVYEVINGRAATPAHGSADMPVWGPVFRQLSSGHQSVVQQRITNLTNYIRSLQQK